MVFNRFTFRITLRLILIFLAMFALSFLIGRQARLFSVLSVLLLLLVLITELFYRISRTNHLIGKLLESIRFGDYNRSLVDGTKGLGFGELAESAQKIISAIAAARIEKETQYLYLQNILRHILTGVITLDENGEPELINPLGLSMLELRSSARPSWAEIEKALPVFTAAVTSIGESGRKMVTLSESPGGKKLLILVNTIKLREKPVRIIAFQDIEPEIGQKEIESWQTISRIMAHEIMNSLTPLSSLTETGVMMLEEEGKTVPIEKLSQKTIENLHKALKTISDRNSALIRFIQNYRQLSRIPPPVPEKIFVEELFTEIESLFRVQCREKGIRFIVKKGPPGLYIHADGTQVNQVLINLVKNGLEALEGTSDPQIDLIAKRILDEVSVEVADNGKGIPPEILDKVFVPFYSTKSGGSGIGLSLSRQVMMNHRGQIRVKSEPGSGSTFLLNFPMK